MISAIHIENLKCFKARKRIPTANLTLFTGFNAAGKSTTIQTLLLASQMFRHCSGAEHLPLNGPIVKLGTPGDVLSEYADSREISIGFERDDYVLWLKLDASEKIGNSLKVLSVEGTENDPAQDEVIRKILNDIIFISAMRFGTDDVFPSPDSPEHINADVGSEGQYAPWWFEGHADDDVDQARHHSSEKAATLRRQFNAWAGELFPGSQANSAKIQRTPLVQLELRMKETEGWRRPANIGYGLTYAFPIIVAGLLANKGQILVVDSPEAHLHPLGQSKIGEFLAVIAAAGVQVFLETHSDHVLNGIRLAVFKKLIHNSRVGIHFFSASTDASSEPLITSPAMDTNGNLSEWPAGFFDQTEKDLAKLAGWDQ